MPTPKRPPAPVAVAPPPRPARRKRAPTAGGQAALRRERQRVAQTLHDTVCQELTGLSLMATVAARRYQTVCPEAQEELRKIAALIQRAGAELGEFVNTLRSDEE